jgi:hypothetical protein
MILVIDGGHPNHWYATKQITTVRDTVVLHVAGNRKARSGANAGNRFWDCPSYPRCWGIVDCEG